MTSTQEDTLERAAKASAILEFDNGFLGFERVVNPRDGKQYLRAYIYSKSKGLWTSAPTTIREVVAFASEAVKQALLSDGYSESEIGDVTWHSKLPH